MTYHFTISEVGRHKLDATCYVIVNKTFSAAKQVINYNLFRRGAASPQADPSPSPFHIWTSDSNGPPKSRLFLYLTGIGSRLCRIFANLIKKIGKFSGGQGGWGDE